MIRASKKWSIVIVPLFLQIFLGASSALGENIFESQIPTYASDSVKDGEGLRIRYWDKGETGPADWNTMIFMGTIIAGLLFLCPILFWLSKGRMQGVLFPKAKDIFMPISYHHQRETSDSHIGYVRQLSKHKAQLLCTEKVAEGELIKLDFGEIPGFPLKEMQMSGSVTSSKQLSSHHFEVWVHLNASGEDQGQAINEYLEVLQSHP